MLRRMNSRRALILLLLAVLTTGATSGCGIIDDIPRVVGPALDDVDEIVRSLSPFIDEIFRGLQTSGDELSAVQRQALKGKLSAISCEVAFGMAMGEEPPVDVIQDQVKSTLVGELGEAMGGELLGDSVSIVYTLAQEVHSKSGRDPLQIPRICAALN